LNGIKIYAINGSFYQNQTELNITSGLYVINYTYESLNETYLENPLYTQVPVKKIHNWYEGYLSLVAVNTTLPSKNATSLTLNPGGVVLVYFTNKSLCNFTGFMLNESNVYYSNSSFVVESGLYYLFSETSQNISCNDTFYYSKNYELLPIVYDINLTLNPRDVVFYPSISSFNYSYFKKIGIFYIFYGKNNCALGVEGYLKINYTTNSVVFNKYGYLVDCGGIEKAIKVLTSYPMVFK
jgi:hypothetical protein